MKDNLLKIKTNGWKTVQSVLIKEKLFFRFRKAKLKGILQISTIFKEFSGEISGKIKTKKMVLKQKTKVDSHKMYVSIH